MKQAVSLHEKKEFLQYFLNHYTLKKKEAAWLLHYVMTHHKLLEKVHFTDYFANLPKLIIISTNCVHTTPFKFYKNNRVTPSVEKAFHDIRSNPHEEIFIGLFFKDKEHSKEYSAVLENHWGSVHHIEDHPVIEVFAEMVLEKAYYEKQMIWLKEAIDEALDHRDGQRFHELSKRLALLEAQEISIFQ